MVGYTLGSSTRDEYEDEDEHEHDSNNQLPTAAAGQIVLAAS